MGSTRAPMRGWSIAGRVLPAKGYFIHQPETERYGQAGGTSIEEESRNCRYQAVTQLLGCDEIYLTAHHADDQAETLFLNLMRGSGS